MRWTSRAVFVSWLLSVPLFLLAACEPDLGVAPFLCNGGEPKCPTGYVCNENNFCVLDGECPPELSGCSQCGDGVCDPQAGEDVKSCPEDCPVEVGTECGDGSCDEGEDSTSCPADCSEEPPPATGCGDGSCDAPETFSNCPADCAPAATCTAGQTRCSGTSSLARCEQGAWVTSACADVCAAEGKLSDGCDDASGTATCACRVDTTKLPYGSFCSGDTECSTGNCMEMTGIISRGAYCSASCSSDNDCPSVGSTASVCDTFAGECMLDCWASSCPSGMSCSEFLYDYKCVPWT